MATLKETLDGLLQGILDHPEELHRRLIYADALEESDDPVLAQWIRYSILGEDKAESPEMVDAIDLPFWSRELIPERDLEPARNARQLNEFGDIPVNEFGDIPGYKVCGNATFWWRNGFVSVVECTLKQWVDNGKRIVRKHPVEEVRILDKRPYHVNLGQDNVYGFESTRLYPEAFSDSFRNRAGCILAEIFELMTGFTRKSGRVGGFYDGVDIGMIFRDLSNACIAWAKK